MEQHRQSSSFVLHSRNATSFSRFLRKLSQLKPTFFPPSSYFPTQRYIIEASLLHAELLDRVLVVPTVVYARACEFDKLTCQGQLSSFISLCFRARAHRSVLLWVSGCFFTGVAYAKMVNRGDALQSDEWRDSPIEKQWAWLIPTKVSSLSSSSLFLSLSRSKLTILLSLLRSASS